MRRTKKPIDEMIAHRKMRRLAEPIWREDRLIRQRTAMEISAFILDEAQEHCLASWLLCALPEFARQIGAGVAVHALLRGVTSAWDALAAVDAMDGTEAGEMYERSGDAGEFVWRPDAVWLTTHFAVRRCDHCRKPYQGPAVYCSNACASADG
jgi:GNAT superfamily N-acetyltransferase